MTLASAPIGCGPHPPSAVAIAPAPSGGPAASASATPAPDERKPETWVPRLDDPARRPAAIKFLVDAYDDAIARATRDRDDLALRQLLDIIVPPLTKLYVASGETLDEKDRVSIIKLLADSRDGRAKAAFVHACSRYAAGGEISEEDLGIAASAIGTLKLEEGADALGDAFVKLQAATQKGALAYRPLHDAMVALHNPKWKALVAERLGHPMERPRSASDAVKLFDFQNELFWQTTAADVAGELGDVELVKPLVRVAMAPAKSDIAGSAERAMVKVGKSAVPLLIGVLNGKDDDLLDYDRTLAAVDPKAPRASIIVAASTLGAIGRPEATEPLLAVLATTRDDPTRATLAAALATVSAEPRAKQAFREAYERIAAKTVMPNGESARAMLLNQAGHFYDPAMVPWIERAVQSAGGDPDAKATLRGAGILAVCELMTPSQASEGKKLGERYGTNSEKEDCSLAADVLGVCGDRVDCYLSKIDDPMAQEPRTQFLGIKAAFMVGELGSPETIPEIVFRLPKATNAAVRWAASWTIDALAKRGADAVPAAEALQKIVDADAASYDHELIGGDGFLKQIIARLRARE
jgi:hypothetical protein